ncbi:DotD/TraH family lipoprotein [Gluconobacter oxydans]|uniref:Secretion protein n=1 Tax=Gluconobacter oxydans TaxID=442 RepID=A0A149RXN5_GLUOY|nr:DotD/TraH family lipoprotein [Gluconobacter oxydans]KXV19247.1 secretion protein [Gluconobacter oxydans]WKE49674.1 DotD/TraH family lipoprotein [Gluconobacter oxydans]
MRHQHFLAPAFLLALSACATTPPEPVAATGMANPELALQRAITSTNQDLAQLGTLRPAPPPMTPDPALPADLKRQVWFVWQGPLEPAVRKLGKDIGYSVTAFGPRRPITVQTNAVAPVVEHLRVLGEQAGDQATVSVDPLSHAISVTYHG